MKRKSQALTGTLWDEIIIGIKWNVWDIYLVVSSLYDSIETLHKFAMDNDIKYALLSDLEFVSDIRRPSW